MKNGYYVRILEESRQVIFTATNKKKFEQLLDWIEEIEENKNIK